MEKLKKKQITNLRNKINVKLVSIKKDSLK